MMRIAFKTDIGLTRTSNQDALIISEEHGLFGVADGMGGHKGGNVASTLAVETILSHVQRLQPSEKHLKKCIQAANRAVYEQQLKNRELSGMGTTMTVLWDTGDKMILGHVGDSRAYLLRKGDFRQLSVDHSVVQELIDQGILTKEQAKEHPYRHMITRAVGTDLIVEPDIVTYEKKTNDIWLVCSDGLTEYLSDAEIETGLTEHSIDDSAQWMVEQALAKGGRDNISVVIVRTDS